MYGERRQIIGSTTISEASAPSQQVHRASDIMVLSKRKIEGLGGIHMRE